MTYLTEREWAILAAAAKYGLSDHQNQYYCLGGSGFVPVRFHRRTLSRLAERGLVERVGYWRATDAGRTQLQQRETIDAVS